jgi:hypothetical protein
LNKRGEENYKTALREYELHLEEFPRWWSQRKVELVEERIELLRRWRRLPAKKGRRKMLPLEGAKGLTWGFVYAARCPHFSAYKIGHTRKPSMRIEKIRCLIDPAAEYASIYETPISAALLEMALHRRFSHFHFPAKETSELFNLPEKEARRFLITAVLTERAIVAVELMRLKALLSEFQREYDQLLLDLTRKGK